MINKNNARGIVEVVLANYTGADKEAAITDILKQVDEATDTVEYESQEEYDKLVTNMATYWLKHNAAGGNDNKVPATTAAAKKAPKVIDTDAVMRTVDEATRAAAEKLVDSTSTEERYQNTNESNFSFVITNLPLKELVKEGVQAVATPEDLKAIDFTDLSNKCADENSRVNLMAIKERMEAGEPFNVKFSKSIGSPSGAQILFPGSDKPILERTEALKETIKSKTFSSVLDEALNRAIVFKVLTRENEDTKVPEVSSKISYRGVEASKDHGKLMYAKAATNEYLEIAKVPVEVEEVKLLVYDKSNNIKKNKKGRPITRTWNPSLTIHNAKLKVVLKDEFKLAGWTEGITATQPVQQLKESDIAKEKEKLMAQLIMLGAIKADQPDTANI